MYSRPITRIHPARLYRSSSTKLLHSPSLNPYSSIYLAVVRCIRPRIFTITMWADGSKDFGVFDMIMYPVLVLSVVLVLNGIRYAWCNPDAKRLYDDLLSNYNRLIRPVSNNTDTVLVKLGLRLSQLIELVRVEVQR